MGLTNILSLIKNCPPWHLLNRAEELRKIVVYLGSKSDNEHDIKCGAVLAKQLIFSALNGWLRPGRATEDNRFDFWCLLSYLHFRAVILNTKTKRPQDLEKLYSNEILLLLLALCDQRQHMPGTLDHELINFLEGWADFLLGEAHHRRVTANG